MRRKIITTIVCIFVSLSTLIFSCCQPKGIEKATFQGVHDYTAPETNSYMVENGKTDYVLVIPQNAGKTIATAKDEFVCLFEKATGIRMPFIVDTGDMQLTSTAKYISLGETSLLQDTDIQMEKARLGTDGGKIITKEKSVFIFGGGDKGTLYTVYTFMNLTFGFEQYFKDCYEIETGLKNVKLRNYAVTDIPDIAYRTNNWGLYNDTSTDYDVDNFDIRMRMGTEQSEPLLPIHTEFDNPASTSGTFHNTNKYLPETTYQKDYPEWFSDAGAQLCYTAHGNEAKYQLMVEEVSKKIINSLKIYTPKDYPLKNTATFTCVDAKQSCTCDACTANTSYYGSKTAAVIQFTNLVGEYVENWMNEPANAEYKRDNFTIIIFAYNDYTWAPCTYDAKKNIWSYVDDSVKMRHNVGVYIAPISSLDYQSSIYAEVNARGKQNIDGWCQLTNNIYLWPYSTNFSYYNYFYDSFNFFNNDGWQYIASIGTRFIFNQGQHNQDGTATGFSTLKMYLDSKMAWDTTQDVNELTDRWFNAMFKEAAPIMKNYFDSLRIWNAKVLQENGLYAVRSIYTKIKERAYWPSATLAGWRAECDKAIQAIEHYKTSDPALYESVYWHIETEWFMPAYVTVKLYGDTLGEAEYRALVARMKAFVAQTGIEKDSEHASVSAWVNSL